MPIARVADDLEMHYVVDDFTEPWRDPETVLLLHGSSESGAMWFGWVPHLARHFRVVRPDMRGFGASTPMPRNYPWALDAVIDDFASLTRQLGIERFHLVGACRIGSAANCLPHARHYDRRQRARFGGGNPCVAAEDSKLHAARAAGRFLSRRGDGFGPVCPGDVRVHT